MATLDFSRSIEQDLQTKEDRLFDAALIFARDDDETVDFSGKDIKMDIYRNDAVIDTLTSAIEITISVATLTFNKTFTDLNVRSYDYRLYNDTNKIGIGYGKLIVI